MPTQDRADPRRRRCLGGSRSDDGAVGSGGGRQAVLPQARRQYLGILNVREQFLKDYPDVVRRVLATYEEARKYSVANYDDLKKTFMAITKLPDAVVDKQAQGAHRTDP